MKSILNASQKSKKLLGWKLYLSVIASIVVAIALTVALAIRTAKLQGGTKNEKSLDSHLG